MWLPFSVSMGGTYTPALVRLAGQNTTQSRTSARVSLTDWAGSNSFRHHRNRPARTLGFADSATLAVVQVELEALAWAQFYDGIVGADAVAVVALEAIATREAAARFEKCSGGIEPSQHFVKARLSPGHVEQRLD